MRMPVVKVREVTMAVRLGSMDVPVRVWLPGRCVWLVRVVVMNVVPMTVIMSQRLVIVLVNMPLAEVQPYAGAHQQAPDQEMARERLAQDDDRQHRTQECGSVTLSSALAAGVVTPNNSAASNASPIALRP
jgi:hypothetical protein